MNLKYEISMNDGLREMFNFIIFSMKEDSDSDAEKDAEDLISDFVSSGKIFEFEFVRLLKRLKETNNLMSVI